MCRGNSYWKSRHFSSTNVTVRITSRLIGLIFSVPSFFLRMMRVLRFERKGEEYYLDIAFWKPAKIVRSVTLRVVGLPLPLGVMTPRGLSRRGRRAKHDVLKT
ncbi:hypothetical protein TNCV_789411 [Trichonephila clavipes]|nr:hypothetical protein TNCV_789411 [Trichonephila clavipes]